ncbi:MAG: 2-C-methyl-D-erythritol 4-phosphate cytidylyltransferase [Gemmatimonadetes bacterium]|nr:MAG: 2-C-methyl-D-erythritol 4-phosphate cytidylyltransferase [Gemmatimonadota bacterium]
MGTPVVTAVIPAGGRGSRVKLPVEKQFATLHGKPLLSYSLMTLQQCDEIQHVVVVVPADRLDYTQTEIIQPYQLDKVRCVVSGGKTRQASIWNGIQAVPPETTIITVHDAARPFASAHLFTVSVQTCLTEAAVIVALKAKDTIKLDQHGYVGKTLDRNLVWLAQTPQTFSAGLLREAYQRALKEGFTGTDDASLIERLSHPIRVIPGEETNRKITTPADYQWAEFYLSSQKHLDSHR